MFLILLSLFVVISLFAFLEEKFSPKVVNIFFCVLVLVMALFAGLRPDNIDHDYDTYVSMYNNGEDFTTEITFTLIADFIRNVVDNVTFLFLLYALVSLTLKGIVIRRLSNLCFLALLMYFSTSYILHDFNQIRAGVATGFMLLGIPYLNAGKRWFYVLFVILATLFHYSAFILIFLCFMDYKPMKPWQYAFYGMIIPFCYLAYFLHINVFYMIPIPYFEEKMEAYENLQHTAEAYDVNVFNLLLLTKIVIVYFLFFYARLIEKHNQYFPVLLKIEVLSIGAFVLFTEVPIVSFRINELLGVVEIVLFPMLFYAFNPKWVANVIVVLMAFILMMIYLFYNKFLYL